MPFSLLHALDRFHPPEFDSEDDIWRARIVLSVLRYFSVIGLLLALISALAGFWGTLFNILVLMGVLLLSRLLLQWRYLNAAGHLAVSTLLLAAVNEMVYSGGLHDMTLLTLPVALILASLLFRRYGYWSFTALMVLAVELVTLGEYTGRVVNSASHLARLADVFTAPVALMAIALIVRLLAEHSTASLEKYRAAAAHSAALAAQAERRVEAVEALNRVGLAITAGLDLQQVLETLYRRIAEVVPINAFYVALYDEASGYLTFPVFYEGGVAIPTDPNDVHTRPGLAGEVILRKASLYVPDVTQPEVSQSHQIVRLGEVVTRSYLGVPLIQQERVVGVMSVQSSQANAYDIDQIALLEALGTQAAIAIENARLYDQTRDAWRRQQRLNALAQSIVRSHDLSALLAELSQRATELLEADMSSLALLSPDGKQLAHVYDVNVPAALCDLALPAGQGLTWHVINTQEVVMLAEYGDHPAAMPELVQAGVHGYLGAPILSGQSGSELVCLGVLMVMRTDPAQRFDEQSQVLLEAVASLAGSVVQNARLYAALRQREVVLETATYAAENFLSQPDWRRGIQRVLMQLGQVTGAAHASLFELEPGVENVPETEDQIVLRYRWSDYARRHEQPDMARLGDDYPLAAPVRRPGWERWQNCMLNRETYHGSLSNLAPDEAQAVARLGVQAVLCAPVFVSGQWWGEIRLSDMRERDWSPVEVDGLKIVAGVLGAAIGRQQAEQARLDNEALYRRTISAAGAVPYVNRYDADRFVFIGEGIEALTGYRADQITPSLWNKQVLEAVMLGEAAGMDVDEAWALAQRGQLETWRCDYRIRARDGSLRWISDTAVEIIGSDGLSHEAIGIMMDITARREAEEALHRLNAELEERVRRRTAELEAANRELEAFAYSVAHDLRAPLRSIDGYSRLLEEDYGHALDADGRIYIENTRLAAQRMGQLIDDLLHLSRVTRTEMRLVEVDLTALAQEVIEGLRRRQPERQVTVDIQPGLRIAADASLMRLALENLLGNAWKFTGHTPNARIEMALIPRRGEMVYFVRDNGAGFDMKYANQLFKAFHRLHSSEDFEGSGVGLATVERIIQRHGGRIWARAALNEGATFYFTLKT